MSSKTIRPVERWLLVTLLTALLWAWFTWPLPQHALSGIPWTGHSTERNPVRTMVAGDHLQLMYHFWLLGDMIRGGTPWFNNLYEFNTGHDDSGYRPKPFYAPFSLVYVAGENFAGRAFGWNLAGFLSLLLTLHFTWRLARQYTDSDRLALAASVIALALPYRWFSLLGGSPTGFGMTFVPMLLYGLDRAIRQHSLVGGLLAGAAVVFAYCTDLHVFYFVALAAPIWCLLALLQRQDFHWLRPHSWWKLVGLLWPVAAGLFMVFELGRLTSGHLSSTDLAGGRSIQEVAAFSPRANGFLGWGNLGTSNHIYLGFIPLLSTVGGFAYLLWRQRQKPRLSLREWCFVIILTGGIVLVMVLALGPNGPLHGALLDLCRQIIPKYKMIRQTPKIYCLMPSFLAALLAFLFGVIMAKLHWKKTAGAILILMVILSVVEFKANIRAGICELDTQQEAYRAVSAHAARHQLIPRALILPIWPGNSHWASLYEHYSSLYRLRMVNGYSPAVSTNYINSVFRSLESANIGELHDDQFTQLRSMGVDYILLHEDAFPEKVSPYPVIFTLNGLLSNPRLELLARSRQVWAFRIRNEDPPASSDSPSATQPIACPVLFPARQWEAESVRQRSNANTIPRLGASGMAYVCLPETDSSLSLRRTALPAFPGQSLLVRTSGNGELQIDWLTNGAPAQSSAMEIRSEGWTWRQIPISKPARQTWLTPRLSARKPFINLDLALLCGSQWRMPAIGETIVLPAASFFHAGYTDPMDGSVTFTPSRDPEGAILYGLNLPLERGEYQMDLRYSSSAPDGLLLGSIQATGEDVQSNPVEIKSGHPVRGTFSVESELPVRLNLYYNRAAGLRVQSWSLSRIK
jgi:hypothetical protein